MQSESIEITTKPTSAEPCQNHLNAKIKTMEAKEASRSATEKLLTAVINAQEYALQKQTQTEHSLLVHFL